MENSCNTGSLDTLKSGQSLLVHARGVNGGKVQLELAEVVNTSTPNILAMFNQSDDRFTQAGARRAWMTVEPSDASQLLGVDLTPTNPAWTTDERGRDILPLNILNPSVDGKVMRLQIVETTEPTVWQAQNLETAAKRRGAEGDFITCGGKYIFSNTQFCFGEPEHVYLEADAPVSASVSAHAQSIGAIMS